MPGTVRNLSLAVLIGALSTTSLAPPTAGQVGFSGGVVSTGHAVINSSLVELIPTTNAAPLSITVGPDGALWFTEQAGDKIGRLDPFRGPVDEFAIPAANAAPAGITTGPDGAIWFTEAAANKVGRLDPVTHIITEFSISSPSSQLGAIAAGPDGGLWFVESNTGKIGRIDPLSHTIFEVSISTPNSFPVGIAAGPDGAVWFTESAIDANKIGRIDPATRVIAEFPIPTAASFANAIVAGPDGAMWFTETAGNKIGRIDPASHAIVEFPLPALQAAPTAITAGVDGGLWFIENNANKIGRIDPTSHAITEFATLTQANPLGIAATPDRSLWLTDRSDNGILQVLFPVNLLTITVNGSGTVTSSPSAINCVSGGANCASSFPQDATITLSAAASAGSTFVGWSGGGCSGIESCTVMLSADTQVTATFAANTASDITLVSAILPGSRSVQAGTSATAFATIVNASSDTAATNCLVQPASDVAGDFLFQATDPKTNGVIAPANTPMGIPAGQSQSFLIAIRPTQAFPPTDVAFSFTCSNAAAAATLPGIDTLLLSSSLAPVPDVIALAATVSNDGILDIPTAGGRVGAFAVATFNVGAAGAVAAMADTGTATLPIALKLCQTNAATGACLQPPGTIVPLIINTNDTPTFAIFAAASDTVAFSPAVNRIFVRFKDPSGTVRGATSVAVRTQ